MLKKIILAAALSLSVSCFAQTGGDKAKPATDSSPKTQTAQPDSSATKENSQPAQDSGADKKPDMVDYCKKHTC